MKIHLTRNCAAVAMILAASGFSLHEAVGQDASSGVPYPGYGYPVASQSAYAPYASTGDSTPAPQNQQSSVFSAFSSRLGERPAYVAMNMQSGVVTSPEAAPAPAQSESSSSPAMMSSGWDEYGYPEYGISGYFGNTHSGRQWFCGVYGLGMTRDEPSNKRLGLLVDTTGPIADYSPVASDTVLTSDDASHNFRGGAEIRFGSTFSYDGAHDYGFGGAPQTYAWEFAYWFLSENSDSARVIDTDAAASPPDAVRLFSGVNFSGLAGILDAENYVIPITVANSPPTAGEDRILAERVRTNFSAQNFELNFLRLPFHMCSPAHGYEAVCGGPSFALVGLCGFRYLRIDDDLQYALAYGVEGDTFLGFGGGGSAEELYYAISSDNHLAGFQLGVNMNYLVASRWDLFWDTNLGLYNNHINASQRVFLGGGGPVTFVNGGSEATVRTDKDDLAFAGEMRLGGAYHINCNNRIVLAYRAIAVAGVALTTEQIPTTFDNPSYVGHIDSSGSIILHGVQVGWERKF